MARTKRTAPIKFPKPGVDETIIPVINICRKLEKCDAHQLMNTIKILSKHNSFTTSSEITMLLRNLLIKCVCSNHMKMPLHLLQETLQSLENISNVNDTITQSALLCNTDDENAVVKINNIIQIPSDLMLYTLQYLEIKELYKFDQCCRYFCQMAHNPNALYYLRFEHNLETVIKYWHPRYSRVQKLDLVCQAKLLPNIEMPALPTFKCIQILYFSANAHTLNVNSMLLFHRKLGTYSTLKHIHFNGMAVENVFNFVSKCRNITKLHVVRLHADQRVGNITENTLRMHKMVNETESTLDSLQEFSIDDESLHHSISIHYFVYWILSNGSKTKKFVLTYCDQEDHRRGVKSYHAMQHFFNPVVGNDTIWKMTQKALLNVKIFHAQWFVPQIFNNITKCCEYNTNIKFDEFVYFFDIYMQYLPITSINLCKPLDMIVARSSKSIFSWIGEFEWDHFGVHAQFVDVLIDWPSKILNSESKIKMYDMINIKKLLDFKDVEDGEEKVIEIIEVWIKLSIQKLFKFELEYDVVFCNIDTQKIVTAIQTMTQKYGVPIEYSIMAKDKLRITSHL